MCQSFSRKCQECPGIIGIVFSKTNSCFWIRKKKTNTKKQNRNDDAMMIVVVKYHYWNTWPKLSYFIKQRKFYWVKNYQLININKKSITISKRLFIKFASKKLQLLELELDTHWRVIFQCLCSFLMSLSFLYLFRLYLKHFYIKHYFLKIHHKFSRNLYVHLHVCIFYLNIEWIIRNTTNVYVYTEIIYLYVMRYDYSDM